MKHPPMRNRAATGSWMRVAIGAVAALGATTAFAGWSSAGAAKPPRQANHVALTLQTSGPGHAHWPRIVPSNITLRKGKAVTLVITSYDDGTAPLPRALSSYDSAQGGKETVNGKAVASEPNSRVAHTFSVPALGVNAVIPAVAKGAKTVTVAFTFTPTKSGTFTWRCFAPCGSGSDGMGGAMATMGWMEGHVTVS